MNKNTEGELGIDEAFISELVDEFYTRIRGNERLGPIFNSAIRDWGAHLPRMKRFWSSVILRTGSYSGQPVPVHQRLSGVEPNDFEHWLALFRKTLDDIAPTEAVVQLFMGKAQRIAMSLKLAMFGSRGQLVSRLPIV